MERNNYYKMHGESLYKEVKVLKSVDKWALLKEVSQFHLFLFIIIYILQLIVIRRFLNLSTHNSSLRYQKDSPTRQEADEEMKQILKE